MGHILKNKPFFCFRNRNSHWEMDHWYNINQMDTFLLKTVNWMSVLKKKKHQKTKKTFHFTFILSVVVCCFFVLKHTKKIG